MRRNQTLHWMSAAAILLTVIGGGFAQSTPATKSIPAPTITVYGFAMTDFGFDLRTNDPNWFDVVRPTKLPSFFGSSGATAKHTLASGKQGWE